MTVVVVVEFGNFSKTIGSSAATKFSVEVVSLLPSITVTVLVSLVSFVVGGTPSLDGGLGLLSFVGDGIYWEVLVARVLTGDVLLDSHATCTAKTDHQAYKTSIVPPQNIFSIIWVCHTITGRQKVELFAKTH